MENFFGSLSGATDAFIVTYHIEKFHGGHTIKGKGPS